MYKYSRLALVKENKRMINKNEMLVYFNILQEMKIHFRIKINRKNYYYFLLYTRVWQSVNKTTCTLTHLDIVFIFIFNKQ